MYYMISLYGILKHTKLIFDGGNHQSVFLGVGVDWEGAAQVKASAWNAGDPGSILGQEDPLEKEMATHSSTLAWRIPWREEPGRLQSIGLQRVRHD